MTHRTWMVGLCLGFVGFSLASGCVVKSDDDDGGSAGEAGDTSTGGSSSGKGGSSGSATGGKGGSSTGGATTGGSSTGGATTGGSSTGGAATGGTGAIGGSDTDPECDPDTGELDNTPYPNCTATAGNPCEECIEANCCEESMTCYGYAPGNVCGWGGPDGDGEITCYVDCAQAYVDANGALDDDGKDQCAAMCATEMCGLIGNATQDLAACIEMDCEDACWPAP